MTPRQLPALLAAASLLIACDDNDMTLSAPAEPAFAEIPADGNGHKQVFPFHFNDLPSCPDGTVITRLVEGWIQVHLLQSGSSRNVELDVFHLAVEFSNSSGGVFRFAGVGPDRYYLDGDDLIVAIVGRSGPLGLIGRLVINLTSGEVEFVAGNEFEGAVALACEKLS